MTDKQNQLSLLNVFQDAPEDTLFSQEIVSVLRCCSVATIERDRWAGTGVPFVKIGRQVRYRKRDILKWLREQPAYRSTSEVDLVHADEDQSI